jgi:hypothetical protein
MRRGLLIVIFLIGLAGAVILSLGGQREKGFDERFERADEKLEAMSEEIEADLKKNQPER